MENSKAEDAAGADDWGAVEARFLELAQASSLDEGVAKKAADLFKECRPVGNFTIFGSGSRQEIEQHWMASAIYCIAKLGDGKEGLESGKRVFNLSGLLTAAKVGAADFFREISQFLLKAGHALRQMYGVDWEKRLEVKEVQTNLVHLRVLSNYYRRAFEEFFLSSDVSNLSYSSHSSSSINPAFVKKYFQFGWLLFLALRVHAFSRFRDLVTYTNGLISILAILILHVPIRFRKFRILDTTRLAKRSDKGLELLASLCDIYHTSEDDLKAAMDKTNSVIVDILKKKPCPASECRADSLAGINTVGLVYFDGLMEDSSLLSSLLMLERDYVDITCARGELDERIFVNDDDCLIGSGSVSASAANVCSSKSKFDSESPVAKTTRKEFSSPTPAMLQVNGNTPGNPVITPSPVSTAMTTTMWLRTIVSPLPSKPTVELERFLSSCDRNITNDVLHRVDVILDAIFLCTCGDRSIAGAVQNTSLMDQVWIDQRKTESMKLYFRVLEAICRAESQILNESNLTPLLSNERFHRCMLACSSELVLTTHKTVTMMFPAVLDRTGITAFDLCKVIENFVRHEETLPRELKRHLNSLEERLLESMAWEKGSSMYNSLVVARPVLSSVINRMGLQAEPVPSLDAIAMHQSESYWSSLKNAHRHDTSPGRNVDIRSPKRLCTGIRNVLVERSTFTSPVKDRLMGGISQRSRIPPLQSAFATPTRQNPSKSGETYAESDISIFYSKIIKLAASRIKGLCEKLQLSHQIMERVYCLFQQILNQQTSLFFNRHIDQLILCCFYGVAKILQLNLSFKDIIINGYRKQPHCKLQVFRSVFVDWSQMNHIEKSHKEHVDIITFYNAVFIPSVKSLLMDIGSSGNILSAQRPEDTDKANGACPGSPRLSPFPSLPDMSPKKVSATHNVYVSPLRPSKMDALLSPSSKSFYACVGESTRAYESPSKDLNAINNRLNSGRRMRLNFDMVSDSLVASTLGPPQNGNSDQASALMSSPDRKCDQNDS